MKRIRAIDMIVIIVCAAMSITALAKRRQLSPRQLDQQTKNFVKKAAALVKRRGRVAASCAFNNPKGHFQRGYRYIFAVTCGNPEDDGFIVADPATPQYNYTNRTNKTPIVDEIVKDSYGILQHSGKWYEYCWINPATHEYHVKRTYVEMIPGERLCVGSGYYLRETCVVEN